MNILKATIPIGIGDLIYVKAMLDNVSNRYDEINLRMARDIIQSHGLSPDYNGFLDDICKLFFSNPPYILSEDPSPFYELPVLCSNHGIPPIKPELKNILCVGEPISIEAEYIVIVTKVRYIERAHFENKIPELFTILRQLSNKYKIVILGERKVELNTGYLVYKNSIYSIYNDIINNISSDKLLDLSKPVFGITAPKLSDLQQDCIIMKNAKFVITIGVGGGFSIATAVSNIIGYRNDVDILSDMVFNKPYPDAFVTKNWNNFISKLMEQ